jgi:hypothetical protein
MQDKNEILVCTNVTLNPIDDIILFKKKSQKVRISNFDNIWIDAANSSNKNIFIHCDIMNVGAEIRSKLYDISYCNKISSFLIQQLTKLKKIALKKRYRIVFTTMTSTIISQGLNFKGRGVNEIINNFNQFIIKNFETINLDYVISQIGLDKTFKASNFYRYSAPYTIKFLEVLSDNLIESFNEDNDIKKKVLILDCDNTIWKGILGEDGENILEFKDTPVGNCFFEVQQSVKNLVKNGVLLCLCTKNNYKDIINLLKRNLMPINLENASIIKSNWKEKSRNIIEISKELNLGLDSFVFVDDSDFELSEVKNKLPMVKTFKVPENIFDYPNFFRKNIISCFNLLKITKEDKKRITYYKNEIKRNEYSSKLKNKNEFIESLQLKLKIFSNNENINYIRRIAQMTEKTNQFNLTTKRYTEEDIKEILKNKNFKIFTGDVSDKFGDYGKTILIILKKEKNSYEIDTFLMSCRVIGRQIEKVFFDNIYKKINSKNNKIYAKYIRTQKNSQVKDFYTKLGFDVKEKNKKFNAYILDAKKNKYKFSREKIKVVYGR